MRHMATPATIFIKLNPNEIGNSVKFSVENLPTGYKCENKYDTPSVKLEKTFMGIYHHWDGDISWLGLTLFRDFNEREKIINLLSAGAISCSSDKKLVPYHAWRNDKWDGDCKPVFTRYVPDMAFNYQYLYDNGEWYVRTEKSEHWESLRELFSTKKYKELLQASYVL